MLKRFAVLPAIALLALGMAAQDDLLGGRPAKSPSVSLMTTAPAPVSVVRGRTAPVELIFRVAPGFHVNSNKPNADYLIPTALKLSPPTDVMISRVTYPVGRDMKFEFMPNEALNVYEGDFRVQAMVGTSNTIPVGTYRVHGALTYQACDKRQCFPPKESPVEFNVTVKKPATATGHRNPGQSPHAR